MNQYCYSEDFIKDAIRTEANIDQVKVDPNFIKVVIKALLKNGQYLDNIKKYVAYGKDFKNEDVRQFYNEDDEIVFNTNTRLFHGILGIVTEAIELLEILHEDMFEEKELNVKHLKEEMGDIDWYKSILYHQYGSNFEESWIQIINKLKERFPEKFDSDKAINRNIEKENEAMSAK